MADRLLVGPPLPGPGGAVEGVPSLGQFPPRPRVAAGDVEERQVLTRQRLGRQPGRRQEECDQGERERAGTDPHREVQRAVVPETHEQCPITTIWYLFPP